MQEHVQAQMPYPVVKIQRQSPLYGAMMMDNVGGDNSEMSAVSHYFYDSLVTREEESIAQTFHKISMVEMRHLEIFGELAYLLGEDPRLWTKKENYACYWTPEYLQYDTDIGALIRRAIQEEKEAIAKYAYQAYKIDDPFIVQNLNRIIEDERQHVSILIQLYQNYFIGKK